MSDLDNLQLSRSPAIFELFIKKWEKVSIELAQYFSDEWRGQNPLWYEGYTIGVPSTNNTLEATHKVIKDEQTFR